jgi:Flp pilus assembly protein CpaB
MTPLKPTPPSSGPNVVGFVGGLAVGLVALILCGAAGLLWVKDAHTSARRGWNLKPVVVAAIDLAQGAELTMEVISQRSVPEQFVTDSVVLPARASEIIGKHTAVAMRAGDPVLWSHFEQGEEQKALFFARDLAAGAVLSADLLEERPVDATLLTSSWARAADRELLVGRALAVPVLKGDPVLQTMLVTK